MADQGADVIQLRPEVEQLDNERPFATKERTRCFHERYELDGDSRRVYCRDCGTEVDAYEVLDKLARDPERYMENRRHLKREEKAARERLAELRRQERNAKARRRRGAMKPEVVTVIVREALAGLERRREPLSAPQVGYLAKRVASRIVGWHNGE